MEEKIIDFIKGFRTQDREGNDVVYVDDKEVIEFAKMLIEAISVTTPK